MKKKHIFLFLFIIFFVPLLMSNKIYATDALDEIEEYTVTVDPRMTDGTLDITYTITWKVLDSTTEGPLEFVTIGTPNSNFDTATAISNNIKTISKYNSSYVKIVFKKSYSAGEEFTFRYSIHQSYMYELNNSKVEYEFTPAWFSDIEVKKLTIRWNSDEVIKSDSDRESGGYLVWTETDMSAGEKLTATVKYNEDAFTALDASEQSTSSSSSNSDNLFGYIWFPLFIICIFLGIFGSFLNPGGYYGHAGFYTGGFHGGGGSHHSSCAHSSCAHSSCAHSCACACAGSGRAGCSKKDFYGTKLTSEKLKKIIEKE